MLDRVRQIYANDESERTVKMATFRKRSDSWRAEIRKRGQYVSASFTTKAEAKSWAIQKEAEILDGKILNMAPGVFVADAFMKYLKEVSPSKGGYRWERVRLTSLCRDPLSRVYLNELKTAHLAIFRDDRLKTVSSGTVNRELNLISAVFTKARKEWQWLSENPIQDLDRPKQPRPRDRLISEDEITRMVFALGYSDVCVITRKCQLVGLFFLLAIETGMRIGEICRVQCDDIFIEKKYVQLHKTKNGDPRKVPLSKRAIELVMKIAETDVRVSSGVASTLFRRGRDAAGIQNLRFHDTRHEAITRLSKKLDVLALARTVGHRDIKSLMIYYNETATELAAMLD